MRGPWIGSSSRAGVRAYAVSQCRQLRRRDRPMARRGLGRLGWPDPSRLRVRLSPSGSRTVGTTRAPARAWLGSNRGAALPIGEGRRRPVCQRTSRFQADQGRRLLLRPQSWCCRTETGHGRVCRPSCGRGPSAARSLTWAWGMHYLRKAGSNGAVDGGLVESPVCLVCPRSPLHAGLDGRARVSIQSPWRQLATTGSEPKKPLE